MFIYKIVWDGWGTKKAIRLNGETFSLFDNYKSVERSLRHVSQHARNKAKVYVTNNIQWEVLDDVFDPNLHL